MKPTPVGKNTTPHICLGLFSIPGTGKTRFIGTGSNVLIIRPPQDHTDSIRKPGARNIQEIICRNWSDMNNCLTAAQNGEYDEFEWVWLDSASLMQDQTLDGLFEDLERDKPAVAKNGVDIATYGQNIHRLGLWVRQMAGQATFNFGFTAHPYWGKNLDDDELLMPWIQGKSMPEKLCGSMNMVGYMHLTRVKLPGEEKAKLRRVIDFNGTERFYAKDQFDAFPKGRLVDPTMPAFMEAVKAARASAVAKPASKKTTTTKRRATRQRSR